jgi:type IV secretory pathway VirB2 component (pilin)
MTDNWFDRFFRDKNGNIVIGQPPNPPIFVWAIASVLQLIFKTGPIHTGLDVIALVAIVIWSLAEIFQGVNYFRRSLGLVVLIATIASRLS